MNVSRLKLYRVYTRAQRDNPDEDESKTEDGGEAGMKEDCGMKKGDKDS